MSCICKISSLPLLFGISALLIMEYTYITSCLLNSLWYFSQKQKSECHSFHDSSLPGKRLLCSHLKEWTGMVSFFHGWKFKALLNGSDPPCRFMSHWKYIHSPGLFMRSFTSMLLAWECLNSCNLTWKLRDHFTWITGKLKSISFLSGFLTTLKFKIENHLPSFGKGFFLPINQ